MSEYDITSLGRLRALTGPGCPSAETLGGLLDEELAAEAASALEDHLRQCASCTNRLIDLRELKRLAVAANVPADVAARAKLLVRTPARAGDSHPRPEPMLVRLRAWLGLDVPQLAALAATAIVILYGATVYLDRAQRSELSPLHAPQPNLSAIFSQRGDASFLRNVVSVIAALPKTLILEQTRGTTNVEVYKRAAPATVLIVTERGTGSGVLIDAGGTVLTNWHVVDGARQVAVVFKPMKGIAVREDLAVAATVSNTDPLTDLALLRVPSLPEYVVPLRLGTQESLEVGQDVHAIGHPKGEVWTYTTGTISQLRPGYEWKSKDSPVEHRAVVIQTQTAINPGNSGGPLLNDAADLVGINAFRGEGEGLSYAISVDTVQGFLKASGSNNDANNARPQISPTRTERFGAQITGTYLLASSTQPDLWLVYREGSASEVRYGATHGDKATSIDTIIIPREGGFTYYYDVDCDGGIDLLGSRKPEEDAVSGYGVPREPFTLRRLAPELVAAVRSGLIPPAKLQLCGAVD